MRTSKTAEYKRLLSERERERVWSKYISDLERASTYGEAKKIHETPISHSSPGRSFYSNFGFFMHHFMPPDGGSKRELEEFLRLLKCFDEEGVLKAGELQRLEPFFQAAIDRKSEF
jgi:hypothetical protein